MLTRIVGGDSGEAQGNGATVVQNVTPEEAQRLASGQEVAVLDIRTPAEFASGRIPGAMNIDFQGADFESRLQSLDREKAYVIHCAAGGRSARSLKFFRALGFKTIYHLKAGMKGWHESKLPVEK